MNELYPLKFSPLFKDKIWGGQKAKTRFGLDFSPLPNCGEAWVLSGYPGNESIVSNGFLKGNNLNELLEVYMEDLLGDKVFEAYGEEFPLLIKILDSNDWLSIQVHPDDELAEKRHEGRGKTEMWYVIDAEPEAELICGFRNKVTREQYLEKMKQNSLASILNYEKAEKGDVFYVPSGRVHALGPGLFIAEIQQSSDITYRIYDYERKDPNGKERELHTELALDALDFDSGSDARIVYESRLNSTVPVVQSPFFHTGVISFGTTVVKNYAALDSFVILFCVEGKCSVQFAAGTEILKAGEVVLIPASMDSDIALVPLVETKVLEVFIP
ncbi:MAG: class I mannose-6-phosphate isomerase [Bacteroidetes bacterium]|nr:class I mannose-6-phosphate isomerase [Bacteroidota bacterium]